MELNRTLPYFRCKKKNAGEKNKKLKRNSLVTKNAYFHCGSALPLGGNGGGGGGGGGGGDITPNML